MTKGIITASDNGALQILTHPFKEKAVESIIAHFGPISHMVITPDNRTLFTTGVDGSIFIYHISEQMFNPRDGTFKPVAHSEENTQNDKKEKNKDPRLKVVDDELAEIVLVKKDEKDEWYER